VGVAGTLVPEVGRHGRNVVLMRLKIGEAPQIANPISRLGGF